MGATNRVYGIDLGTTYSCISYVDEHGKPVIVPNSEGQLTTPSVVYFEDATNIAVGAAAKDVAELYPDRVVSTVKRVMGDADWIFEREDKTYHPQDVSALILRKLVEDAHVFTGDTITDVVITCPAYFGVTQKEATRQAGEVAGLNVRYIIPEPTAAAIAYGIEQGEEQVILVYDLGGGTFDVTLIEVKPDAITVICTGGDHMLGGRNWDEAVAHWLAGQFFNDTGVQASELTGSPETWQELLNYAESAKVTLSSRNSCTLKIQYEADRCVVELSREQFDEITSHLLSRTLTLTDDLMATAQAKGYSSVDKILLVGGSTYMPQVIDAVKEKFAIECQQFDPNQSVAKGAAIFGFKCHLDEQIKIRLAEETGEDIVDIDIHDVPENVLSKVEEDIANDHGLALPGLRNLTNTTVTNVTSKSFGIVVTERSSGTRKVNNLIVVNEAVPLSVSREYGTLEDDQDGITLECMENIDLAGPDGPMIELQTSTEIGKTELRFTRALPKGSPAQVRFSLSEDGLLTVHGKDLTTDQEIEAQFNTTAILSDAEIDEKRTHSQSLTVT